jgi:hypothetical protein
MRVYMVILPTLMSVPVELVSVRGTGADMEWWMGLLTSGAVCWLDNDVAV